MRTRTMLGLLAVGWLVGNVAPAVAGAENILEQKVDGKIRWVYSYDEGKEQARKTGKPLLVVFRCER